MCGSLETNDHLWECPALADERAAALSTFIQSSIDIGTPRAMVHVMHYRLRNLFRLPVDTLGEYKGDQDTPITNRTIQAGQAQDELGWDNFIKGRHCSLWEDMYASYLTTIPPPKTKYKKGLTWAMRLIRESIKLQCQVWMLRIKEINEHDDSTNDIRIRDQRVRQRVTETYKNRETYNTFIQEKFFNIPLDIRLSQSTFQLVKWLETVDRAHNAWDPGSNADIYQHFHPTRPPDLPPQ